MTRSGTLFVALTLALARPVLGQVSAAASGLVETYTFGNPAVVLADQVQVISSVVQLGFGPMPGLSLGITTGYADAIATYAQGGSATWATPLDTRVLAEARAGGFLLRGTAVLPTGDAAFTPPEAFLVGILSSELLPFETTAWGTGGGFAIDGGVAGRVGGYDIQLTGGVSRAGSFQPTEDLEATYRPGTGLRFRAAIETPLGPDGVASVLFGVRSYMDDGYEEQNVFRSGLRVDAAATYALPVGARESVLAYAGAYFRGEGSPIHANAFRPLLPQLVSPSSRRVVVGGVEARVERSRVTVVPRGSFRSYAETDGLTTGWLASLGLEADVRLVGGRHGRRALLTPSVRVRAGNLSARDVGASGLSGWTAGLALRFVG